MYSFERRKEADIAGIGDMIDLEGPGYDAEGKIFKAIKAMNFDGVGEPEEHLKSFEEKMKSMKEEVNPQCTFCCWFFKQSLTGVALRWYENFNPYEVKTWEEVRSGFMRRFYDKAKFDRIWRKIAVFRQAEFETLNEAWRRYCEYLESCPHHGFTMEQVGSIFYRGLHGDDQYVLDFNSHGCFDTFDPEERLKMIGVFAESDCGKYLEKRNLPAEVDQEENLEELEVQKRLAKAEKQLGKNMKPASQEGREGSQAEGIPSALSQETLEVLHEVIANQQKGYKKWADMYHYLNVRIDACYKMFGGAIDAIREDMTELQDQCLHREGDQGQERRFIPRFRGQLSVIQGAKRRGFEVAREAEQKRRRMCLIKTSVGRPTAKQSTDPIPDGQIRNLYQVRRLIAAGGRGSFSNSIPSTLVFYLGSFTLCARMIQVRGRDIPSALDSEFVANVHTLVKHKKGKAAKCKQLCMIRADRGEWKAKISGVPPSEVMDQMSEAEHKLVKELYARYAKGLREAKEAVDEFSRVLHTGKQINKDITGTDVKEIPVVATHASIPRREPSEKETNTLVTPRIPFRTSDTWRKSSYHEEQQKQQPYQERHQSPSPFIPSHQRLQQLSPQIDARLNILEMSIAEVIKENMRTTTEKIEGMTKKIQQIEIRVDCCAEETREVKLAIMEFHKVILELNEREEQQESEQTAGGSREQDLFSVKEHEITPKAQEEEKPVSEDEKEIERELSVDRPSAGVDRPSLIFDEPREVSKQVEVQPVDLHIGATRVRLSTRKEAYKEAKVLTQRAMKQKTYLKNFRHIYVYKGEPGKEEITSYNCILNCRIGCIENADCLLIAGYMINIMSSTFAKKFGMLRRSNVIFNIGEGQIRYPEGTVNDIIVRFGDKFVMTSFLVYKFEEEPAYPVILGQPFLCTGGYATSRQGIQHLGVDKPPSD